MQYASTLSLCYIPRPGERILNNKILSSEQAQELLLRKTWLQKVLFSAQEHTQHPEVRTVRTIHCIQCETNQNVTSGKTCSEVTALTSSVTDLCGLRSQTPSEMGGAEQQAAPVQV